MRVRFCAGVVLTALGAALFAIGFRSALALLYRTLYHEPNVVEAMRGLAGPLRLVVPLVATAAAGLIVRWHLAQRAGRRQGVSNVMEAVALGTIRLSPRATLRRVAASGAAIAGGMSIGREGPLIEFGGTLGAAVGKRLRTQLSDRRVLVAAGTAAGFAAAYNTPFAATLFVLETMAGMAALDLLLPAITSTVVATAVTRAVVGGGPIYGQRAFAMGSNWEFLAFAGLGIVAALAGIVFKAVLSRTEDAFKDHALPQPWRAMVGGLVVGLILIAVPDAAGNGYEPLNAMLDGSLLPLAVLVLLLTKIVATSASVGCGIPGGIFTPMLLVGGAVGTLTAHTLDATGLLPGASPGSFALVGMAATTAASLHAPLTAAVLVFELSGDYGIVLPLLLATVIATSLSRALGGDSVYEAELRRRGLGWRVTLEGREVVRPADVVPTGRPVQ